MKTPGLATRLFTVQILVLLVGALSLIITALLLAPPIFSSHLDQIAGVGTEVTQHAQEAFGVGLGIALLVGAIVALCVAAATSALLVRRIAKPIGDLAEASRRLADGEYDVEITRSGLGPDFSDLENAFENMAHRLERTEALRHQLVADMVHEIRTPVSVLDAYIEGLQDGVMEPRDSTWAVMQSQTQRLCRLAADLGELSAMDERVLLLVRSDQDLSATAHLAAMAFMPRFSAKLVGLRERIPDEPVEASIDNARIGQVLANCLDNALRHTPSGGTVTVSLERDRPGWVTVSVTDTGDGIAPGELEHVFDRFHRGDPARSRGPGTGSGLGLTIARGIARAHGGDLRAESGGSGCGTTVRLDLPVASDASLT